MCCIAVLPPPPPVRASGPSYVPYSCSFSGKVLGFSLWLLWQLAACHLPPLSLLDLCGARGRKRGTPSPQHGCQTCLPSVLAPRSPVLKGPAEWGFHRPLRGGNKSQGRLLVPTAPTSVRQAECWEDWKQDSRGIWILSVAQLSGQWGGVGLAAGGRNWLEGRVRNPTWIPGARPAPGGWGGGGEPDELAANPAPPYSALIRRQHQRELKINDDICLTEEMEREGSVDRAGVGAVARQPDYSTGQHLRTATGKGGVRGGEAKLALWST